MSFAALLPASRSLGQAIEPGITVGIREFATVPTLSGNPARMSVMTADPAGRLFVNDQRGRLFTVSSDGATVTEYLNLSSAGVSFTQPGNESGFQSFAFHPDFNTPSTAGFGKFYTLATHSDTGSTPTYPFTSNTSQGSFNVFDSVVYEWTTDPAAGTYTGGAPREVLRLEQPRTNHNGGLIAFNYAANGSGDRQHLYIALGDGGSGNDPWNIARDPGNLYGKILRINPLDPDGAGAATYSVPGNVFAGDGDPTTLPEIYAYGLRNPQRFGWDTADGTLYAADIGQNSFEEINLIVDGGNYGWDLAEGTAGSTAGTVLPIAHYNHGNNIPDPKQTFGNRAITMGDVVRGTGIQGLDGLLLAGDFPTGVPLYIDVDAGDPAPGSGAAPFAELLLADADNGFVPVDLIDLIDANRQDTSTRADLRWSVGIDGRVFVLNKRDGIIRELVAMPGPADLSGDGDVDDEDLGLFFSAFTGPDLSQGTLTNAAADLTGDGDVDDEDLGQAFSSFTGPLAPVIIPEPSSLALLVLLMVSLSNRGGRVAPCRRR